MQKQFLLSFAKANRFVFFFPNAFSLIFLVISYQRSIGPALAWYLLLRGKHAVLFQGHIVPAQVHHLPSAYQIGPYE